MPDEYPEIETRSVDEIVADVIDDLPDAISDRNASSAVVKFIEACGAFYGSIRAQLNNWPRRLEWKIFELLGIEPHPATAATVVVDFTAASEDGATIPADTIVKAGTGRDDPRFETVTGIQASEFEENDEGEFVASVEAEATQPGSHGNIAPGTVTRLNEPISGVDSVTNPDRAFGGSDEETISELRERAPLEIRTSKYAITHEEFRLHSENIGEVERAHSIGGQGFVVMHILDEGLNESPSDGLQNDVQAELMSRTVPGVKVSVNQFALRLVRIPEIEAVLDDDADPTEVAADVEELLRRRISAVDVIDDDTTMVLANGWDWGRSLHINDIIAWLADVNGLERVEEVYVQVSDDYGENWFPEDGPAQLSAGDPVHAGADGEPNNEFGLIHLDGETQVIAT